jgi:hypothetical protein
LHKTELAFEGHNFREIYRLASKNAGTVLVAVFCEVDAG